MRKALGALVLLLVATTVVLYAQQSPADVAAQAEALKAVLAGYGSTVSSSERTDFGRRVDTLKAAILTLQAPAPPAPQPDTWKSEFWNCPAGVSPAFPTTAPALVRYDAAVDFDFGNGAPGAGINANNFCDRFTRTLALQAGTYVFSVTVDDGALFSVDGVLRINQWRDTAPITYTWTQAFATDGTHTLELKHYDNCCGAVVRLSWTFTPPVVAQPPPTACTYALAPTALSLGSAAGSGTVAVTTQVGCAWAATVATGGAWLSVTGATGTGSGQFGYATAANASSAQRTGSIAVGMLSLPVTQAAGVSTPPPTTGKAVLQPSDFTYRCYYNVELVGANESAYAAGLTSRRVNGDLRLMMVGWNVGLEEFSLAGKSCGDTITVATNTWPGISRMDHLGIWWDEPNQRLCRTSAIDYNANYEPGQITCWTLNANGTTSNQHGPIGLQNPEFDPTRIENASNSHGIHAKSLYGGCQENPVWFQALYGVPRYSCGWGGYSSLVSNGASMGLTMFALPDPAGYPNGTEIPASLVKILANHDGAEVGDWYSGGGLTPAAYDRGRRIAIPGGYPNGSPINYFDDPARLGNLPTPPSGPPSAGAQWLSPIPAGPYTGQGRWVPGDTYNNTGLWIDGVRSAFVAFLTGCGGKCYYMSSDLQYDRFVAELHIYDPADLGAVALGQKKPWQIQPASVASLSLPGFGDATNHQASPVSTIGGATYDPVGHAVYAIVCGSKTGIPDEACRVYVFDVNVN